jgi:DNA-binding GntR family transcriptional regulator
LSTITVSKRGRRWPKGAPTDRKLFNLTGDGETPLPDDVYALLRRMILYSHLKPGEWLRQADLADQLGVSRTPVREALHLLSRSGLVELVPNHGARVTPLTFEEFEETYALRTGIEGLAARLAARHCQATDRNMLEERIKALQETANSATTANYLRAEWRFRVACYQIPRRESLLNQIVNLRELSERYLKLAYQSAENMQESLQFHIKLFDAIAANDEVRAEAVNIDALRWTLTRAGSLVRHKLDRSSQ